MPIRIPLLTGIFMIAALTPMQADEPIPVPSHIQGPQAPVPPDYFGMHIHRALTTTPWPTVHFKNIRLWDAGVTWTFLEPHKGDWHFDSLDKLVTLAANHGASVLLTFGRTPPWASALSGNGVDPKKSETIPAKSMDDWRDFVRKVATRYKGKIQAYEVWNEPNLAQFYGGDVPTLVAMTKEAAQIIHSIDPAALVVSPSPTGPQGLEFLRQFLSAGGGQYVDVIGYHLYVTPDPPEEIAGLAQQVKSIVAQHHLNLPVWDTETGWSKPKYFSSNEEASAWLARAMLLAWVSGIDRFYWYAWDNRGWCTLTLTNDDESPNVNAFAYSTIQNWMTGKQVENCSRQKDHTWVCNLKDGASESYIFWNPDKKVGFTPPQGADANTGWRLRELSGKSSEAKAGEIFADQQPRLLQPAGR
jgi:hypothetical protein